jgi:hypothetical protein
MNLLIMISTYGLRTNAINLDIDMSNILVFVFAWLHIFFAVCWIGAIVFVTMVIETVSKRLSQLSTVEFKVPSRSWQGDGDNHYADSCFWSFVLLFFCRR